MYVCICIYYQHEYTTTAQESKKKLDGNFVSECILCSIETPIACRDLIIMIDLIAC